jgi:hypothetical protein
MTRMKRILTVLTLAAVLVGNAIAAQQVYNPRGVLKNYQIGPSQRTQIEGGWESWLLNHQQWIRSLPRPLPTDIAESVLIQNVEVFVDGNGVFYTLRFDEDGNYTVESGLVGKKPERVISRAQIQDQVKQQMLDFSRKPTEPKAKPKLSSFSLGAIIEAGYSEEELKEARFDFSFRRNMVQAELNTACKGTGSADSCKETFEAASLAVLINDPDKGGAAEWTGRKAKEVSDDLVKLGGTQEQLMDVIKASTDNVKYIERTLPASARIDGPKEAAAVNLVKAAVNLTKVKPAATSKEDEFNQTAKNVLSTLNTVKSMNVVSVNNNIITPTVNSMHFIGSVSQTTNKMINLSTANSRNMADMFQLESRLKTTIEQYYVGIEMQATQNDAPTTVQQQQQNCNPQFQDC